jgi:hypothetical protein
MQVYISFVGVRVLDAITRAQAIALLACCMAKCSILFLCTQIVVLYVERQPSSTRWHSLHAGHGQDQ